MLPIEMNHDESDEKVLERAIINVNNISLIIDNSFDDNDVIYDLRNEEIGSFKADIDEIKKILLKEKAG